MAYRAKAWLSVLAATAIIGALVGAASAWHASRRHGGRRPARRAQAALGLMLGALTLARLAWHYDPPLTR